MPFMANEGNKGERRWVDSAISRTLLKKPRQGRRRFLLAGTIITVLFSLFYVFQPDFIRFLDLRVSDAYLRANPKGSPAGDVLIVDIDEKSLARYGQWPWPRYQVAHLFSALRDLGPSAVGIDAVFPEADRTSLSVVQRDIRREYGRDVPLGNLPPDLVDNDRVLAGTLRKGPFVLGFQFLFDAKKKARSDCRLHPVSLDIIGADTTGEGRLSFFKAGGAVCSLPEFNDAVTASGFFNISVDKDGLLRRIPMIIRYDAGPDGPRYYPSLALAVLMKSRNVERISVKLDSGTASEILFDDFRVPIDAYGNMELRFLGRAGRAFASISAADVLSGRVPKERVQGRIVFVGTSSVGIGERRATPVDPFLPGVEIHATAAQNILRHQHVLRPSWISGAELLIVVAAGLLSALVLARTGAAWGLFALAVASAGLWMISGWIFQNRGIFVSPLVPLLAVAFNFSALTLMKFWREEKLVRKRTGELLLANKAMEGSLVRLGKTMRGTVRALAHAAESRDPYTADHQRRVADLARAIATEMGLPAEQIDGLHLAGTIHDLGKISVPTSLLSMPRKLTELEFRLIKTHPQAGYEILKDIDFPWPIARMVLEHHERMDGSGYPNGLTGEQILIESRIMTVADCVEAIATDRPYRPALGIDYALQEIESKRGAFYDPVVVDACLRLFRQKGYRLAK
jgi:adenylate cyclase